MTNDPLELLNAIFGGIKVAREDKPKKEEATQTERAQHRVAEERAERMRKVANAKTLECEYYNSKFDEACKVNIELRKSIAALEVERDALKHKIAKIRKMVDRRNNVIKAIIHGHITTMQMVHAIPHTDRDMFKEAIGEKLAKMGFKIDYSDEEDKHAE